MTVNIDETRNLYQVQIGLHILIPRRVPAIHQVKVTKLVI